MINMPGGPELMVIFVIALLVLGPEQLPKAVRTFGNVVAEIRKVSGGFQDEMRKAMDTIESSVTLPDTDKPMSEKPPSGAPDEIETTGSEAVARGAGATDGALTTPSPEPVAGADRPAIDPADRAAG